MFFAHPALIGCRGQVYALEPNEGQRALHRYGAVTEAPSRYAPYAGSVPAQLAEAMKEYPGPCGYWGAHCDEGEYASPLRQSREELTGLPWPEDMFEENDRIFRASTRKRDEEIEEEIEARAAFVQQVRNCLEARGFRPQPEWREVAAWQREAVTAARAGLPDTHPPKHMTWDDAVHVYGIVAYDGLGRRIS